MGFQLRNCSNNAQVIITDTVLTGYVGQIVYLEEYVDICWEVVQEVEFSGDEVTVLDCYQSCEDCARIEYQLTDCTGRLLPKYSVQEDLEEHIGEIIKVPYYGNACFTVTEIRYDNETRSRNH